MKIYFFLTWLLLTQLFSAKAQEVMTVVRKDSAIKATVVRRGRYSSVLYTMNGEPLTTSTIKRLLKSYPKSAAEFHKYRVQQRWAYAMIPVYMGALIVGINQANKQQDATGSRFSEAPVPLSISLAAFAGSIALAVTNNHYGKAIEAYNSQFK